MGDPQHRHRRLGRDTLDHTVNETVQHDIANAQHAHRFQGTYALSKLMVVDHGLVDPDCRHLLVM